MDDRLERPGVKFKDADLIGLPIRVTVGKKATDGILEVKLRNSNEVLEIEKSDLQATIAQLLKSGE